MSSLCQLSDVKTYLGITDSNSDAVLTTLIGNVSTAIESFCNRVFAQASYSENRNGGCGQKMFLYQGPVTSVTSVTVNGQSVPQAPDQVSYGFVWDDTTVYIRPGQGGGAGGPQEFYKGIQNVTVDYTAGYASVPPDVNQACVLWVATLYAKRSRVDKRSETLGPQQTQAYDMSAMPAAVQSMLQSYQRWGPR